MTLICNHCHTSTILYDDEDGNLKCLICGRVIFYKIDEKSEIRIGETQTQRLTEKTPKEKERECLKNAHIASPSYY